MMKEDDIIEAIKNGQDKYHELVERYHAGLIIHCDKITGNRDDAEDIAQEAFVKAYVDISKYDSAKGRFSTWLYRIATNMCLNHLKKSKRQITVEDVEILAEATMPAYLEEEQRREIFEAVMALVPPEYRRAVEAYYWQGLSYQEIADELDVPINTLRTWLHRAKEQLKGKLA